MTSFDKNLPVTTTAAGVHLTTQIDITQNINEQHGINEFIAFSNLLRCLISEKTKWVATADSGTSWNY